MPTVSIEEVMRYRAAVRERLARRNRLVAIVAVAAAVVPFLARATMRDVTGCPLAVALLAAPATTLIWHLYAAYHPTVVCPTCGDDWTYDGVLKTTACERCGLAMPTAEVASS